MKIITNHFKKIPWWILALVVDGILFWIMTSFDLRICGGAVACYRSNSPTIDRMADYLAVVVAVMAILIPVAIEVLRERFQTHNMKQKTALENEWDKDAKRRYRDEPIGSIGTFVVLSIILPLFIQSSALFYAATFYGIYLLFYVFYVSFYKPPMDIYDADGLNPIAPNLPSRDILSELSKLTLENPQSSLAGGQANDGSQPVWSYQLTEEKTLEKFGIWSDSALLPRQNIDPNVHYFWVVFGNFVLKCDINTLWLSAYDGVLKNLFRKTSFYAKRNISHAISMLRMITERFLDENTYTESVGELMLEIPINGFKVKKLQDIFGSSFRVWFFKSDEVNYVLDSFPKEWTVSESNLNNSTNANISTATASIFLQWIWDLQSYASDINEKAVQATTEKIFPEVEVMLFAKFILLWVNTRYLSTNDSKGFQEAIDRWHMFGHFGRVTAEFTPLGSEEDFDQRYYQNLVTSSNKTVALIKKLGWFTSDYSRLEEIYQQLQALISGTTWNDNYKRSWSLFADELLLVADTPNESGI